MKSSSKIASAAAYELLPPPFFKGVLAKFVALHDRSAENFATGAVRRRCLGLIEGSGSAVRN